MCVCVCVCVVCTCVNNLHEDSLEMLYGPMTPQSKWRAIDAIAAEKKESKAEIQATVRCNMMYTLIRFINSFILSLYCRPKQPVKVHVWAGISLSGMTGICIFEGKMDACLYTEILEGTLLPFIQSRMPNHCLMQNNDPRHTRLGMHKISMGKQG